MDTEHMERDHVGPIIDFLSLHEGCYPPGHLQLFGPMLKQKERLLVCPFIRLRDGSLLYGSQCVYNALLNWNNLIKGHFLFELPQASPVLAVIKQMHKTADDILEERVWQKLKQLLLPKDVEFRINNFKRLSPSFASRPDCGEIDILCINRATKTVFVFEVKNVVKRPSNYHVKHNIQEFFLAKNAYYKKLLKKKKFVETNLPEILKYFFADDVVSWCVKEAFVTRDMQFAAFYNHQKADFILPDELEKYLSSEYNTSVE